jgi:N-acetyltransferase
MNKLSKIEFETPSFLENNLVRLRLLQEDDFETLFKVASDPLIWEQHPNRERYQRPVFEVYFKGAMECKMAFLVSDKRTGETIGCSRFYDFNEQNKTICIGYTFLSRNCWGKSFNKSLKTIMLNHAFKFVDTVIFHVGNKNIRSQKAMEKLGAVNSGEEEMSYYGELPHTNIIYQIEKKNWS